MFLAFVLQISSLPRGVSDCMTGAPTSRHAGMRFLLHCAAWAGLVVSTTERCMDALLGLSNDGVFSWLGDFPALTVGNTLSGCGYALRTLLWDNSWHQFHRRKRTYTLSRVASSRITISSLALQCWHCCLLCFALLTFATLTSPSNLNDRCSSRGSKQRHRLLSSQNRPKMSGQEGITTKSDSGRSGSPDEKPAVAMIEGQQNLGALSEDDARFLSNFLPEDHKKVIRKVDVRHAFFS